MFDLAFFEGFKIVVISYSVAFDLSSIEGYFSQGSEIIDSSNYLSGVDLVILVGEEEKNDFIFANVVWVHKSVHHFL